LADNGSSVNNAGSGLPAKGTRCVARRSETPKARASEAPDAGQDLCPDEAEAETGEEPELGALEKGDNSRAPFGYAGTNRSLFDDDIDGPVDDAWRESVIALMKTPAYKAADRKWRKENGWAPSPDDDGEEIEPAPEPQRPTAHAEAGRAILLTAISGPGKKA
jgi:hypothetical protein